MSQLQLFDQAMQNVHLKASAHLKEQRASPLAVMLVVLAAPDLAWNNTKPGRRVPSAGVLIEVQNMGTSLDGPSIAQDLVERAAARLERA